jgi:hypothetical protein
MWLAAMMLMAAGPASADRLPGPAGLYSFDFPAGWQQLPQEGYTLTGPNNETLVEIATPNSARSIGELSRATMFIAPAMGFDKPGKDDVNIEGADWQGAVTFLRGKYGAKQVKSTLMVFIVRAPKGFRTFWLVASDKVFAEQEASYMTLFKSLQFAAAPNPPPDPEPAPAAAQPAPTTSN